MATATLNIQQDLLSQKKTGSAKSESGAGKLGDRVESLIFGIPLKIPHGVGPWINIVFKYILPVIANINGFY
jgi:hypothetical protein